MYWLGHILRKQFIADVYFIFMGWFPPKETLNIEFIGFCIIIHFPGLYICQSTTRDTAWRTSTSRWTRTCPVTSMWSTFGPWSRTRLCLHLQTKLLLSFTDKGSPQPTDRWEWPVLLMEEKSVWTSYSQSCTAPMSSRCPSPSCTMGWKWKSLSPFLSNPWSFIHSF